MIETTMKVISVSLIIILVLACPTRGLNCECGQEQISSRVLDGRDVTKGQYPWIASILSPMDNDGSYGLCTGTLINDRFILTAASCFTEPLSLDLSKVVVTLNVYSKREYTSMVGGYHQVGSRTSDTGHRVTVDMLFVNPSYDPLRTGNIALLRLASPVSFNETFSPICLASFIASDGLFTIGYGRTSMNSELVANRLNEAGINPLNHNTCNQIYKSTVDPNGDLSDTILCGNGDPGILAGDFGGPLLVRVSGQVYQMGISSHYFLSQQLAPTGTIIHGHEHSNKLFDAFEKIGPHLPWIESVTKDSGWCRGTFQAINPTDLFSTSPVFSPLRPRYPAFRPVPVAVPMPMYNGRMVPRRPTVNTTIARKPMLARKQPSRVVASQTPVCECGLEVTNTRIINGRPVGMNQYPWMVSILSSNDGNHYGMCGGSLINDRFILTAAHCLFMYPDVTKMVVTLGSYTQEDRFKKPNLEVESIHVHPEYIHDGEINDIALIKLREAINFNGTISPICLPLFVDQDNLFVTGWGLTSNGYDQTTGLVHLQEGTVLQSADINEVDMGSCQVQYSNVDVLKDICAGGESGGTCLGDSGGPLSTRIDGNVYQVGVTSFGAVDCGVVTKSPNVFERTTAHLGWIGEVTNPSNWCRAKHQAITND